MAPQLRYLDLEFELQPRRSLVWPVMRRGIMLRGILGVALRSGALRQSLFSPVAMPEQQRLRGNRDRVRPFVVAPALVGPGVVEPGDVALFVLRLFGKASGVGNEVAHLIHREAERGIGVDRVPCTAQVSATVAGALDLGWDRKAPARADARITFLSPVELKEGGLPVKDAREVLPALVKRARDRVSGLYHLYEDGPALDWDFAAIGAEAEQGRVQDANLRRVSEVRTSSRTGQTHALEGWLGHLDCSGLTPAAMHMLDCALITHVGKHATFGQGRIRISQP